MKYFKEYIKLDLNVSAKEIKKYWRKNKIFKKSISSKEGKKNGFFMKVRHHLMDFQGYIIFLVAQ